MHKQNFISQNAYCEYIVIIKLALAQINYLVLYYNYYNFFNVDKYYNEFMKLAAL